MSLWKRASLALAVVALGVSVLVVATGAVSSRATLTAADERELVRIVDRYWTAKHAVWPKAERQNKHLSDSMRNGITSARRSITRDITTGKLAQWEEYFDQSGFLEEVRASGTVITGSGHEVVRASDFELTDQNRARATVTLRTWCEEYSVDDAKNTQGKPYRIENVDVYVYDFVKIDGKWRISESDLISSPL